MLRNVLIVLMLLNLSLIDSTSSSCDDRGSKSSAPNWSERYNSRVRAGTKMFKVFMKACGPDFIPEDQLQAAENCSYKKLLNRTTTKVCEQEVYGNKTLEEIRRIKCLRKTRDELYTKFMDCYTRENPEDSDIRMAKIVEFQTFSRSTKKVIMKDAAMNYTYELESLVETRVVKEVFEPYDFKPIDSSENGPVPTAWDAPVTALGNFMEGEITYLIPHSEEVITCQPCEGDGNVFCSVCKGLGRRRFSVMYPNQSPNSSSKLSVLPEPPCYKCKTTGQVRCKECDGVGSLKRSLLMTVTWKKLHDHVYSGEAAATLPIKKLKKVKGIVIKSEWGQRVSPLTGPLPSTQYSIPEVAQASIELQLKHATQLKDSRIVEQRQTVEQIPITIVNYGRDVRRKSSFFVYGMEREVFFPDSSSNNSCDSASQTSESSTESTMSEAPQNFKPLSLDSI